MTTYGAPEHNDSRFLEFHFAIGDQLESLTDLHGDHFNVDPDDITREDVAALRRIAGLLGQAHDIAMALAMRHADSDDAR